MPSAITSSGLLLGEKTHHDRDSGAILKPRTNAASALSHSASKSTLLATFQKLAPTGGAWVLSSLAASPQQNEWYINTWTDRPFAEGIVLIGDAAGHNSPSVGCGLSIAMRDARIVRDLVLAGARCAQDFAPYGVERLERLRRLRLIGDLIAAATVEAGSQRSARRKHFAQAMATMDKSIFPIMFGMFSGPETIPAHLVNDAVLDRIRAV